jgi:hypothetical protein
MRDFINNNNGLFVALVALAPIVLAAIIVLIDGALALVDVAARRYTYLEAEDKRELVKMIDDHVELINTEDVLQKSSYPPMDKEHVKPWLNIKKKLNGNEN